MAIILSTALVAVAIVVVTKETAGLTDLVTLVLSVTAVVLPLVTKRRSRRR